MKRYENPIINLIDLNDTDVIATSLTAGVYNADDEENVVFGDMF